MCLEKAKRVFPQKDLKVYKVFCRNPLTNELFSPVYGGYEWKIGETQKTGTSDADHLVTYSELFGKENVTIGGNAFHSLKKKSQATSYAHAIANNRIGGTFEIVLAECTIPKGSKYTYKGDVLVGGVTFDGYASQSLIVDKIISKPFNVVLG